jgi:hypothetical protein
VASARVRKFAGPAEFARPATYTLQMAPGDAESGDLSRMYVMVIVCEAAVIAALWMFERIFS